MQLVGRRVAHGIWHAPCKIGVILALVMISLAGRATQQESAPKPRVIVSSDIGGSDPDDFQSMIHYLVYADRFDTEGLISSPPDGGRASDFLECLEAYEKDYPNLKSWSAEYPSSPLQKR